MNFVTMQDRNEELLYECNINSSFSISVMDDRNTVGNRNLP